MIFGKWIKKLFPFVSTDITRETLRRICIRGDKAIATNGVIYIETALLDEDEKNTRRRDALLDPHCIETALSHSNSELVFVDNKYRNANQYTAHGEISSKITIEDNLPAGVEYPKNSKISGLKATVFDELYDDWHSVHAYSHISLSLDELKKLVNLAEDGAINVLQLAINDRYFEEEPIEFTVTSYVPDGEDGVVPVGRKYEGYIMPMRDANPIERIKDIE